jgi:hypothetical protein
LEDLGKVLDSIYQVDYMIKLTRNHLKVNAEELFNEINKDNLRSISSRVLKNWILEHLGCKISDDDSAMILARYDKVGDYKISK